MSRAPAAGGFAKLRSWAGLAVSGVAWLMLQQGSGSLVHYDCAKAGPPLGPLAALAAIGCCLSGGWISWREASRTGAARRFVGRINAGIGCILAFACGLLALSTLLVPPCAR